MSVTQIKSMLPYATYAAFPGRNFFFSTRAKAYVSTFCCYPLPYVNVRDYESWEEI